MSPEVPGCTAVSVRGAVSATVELAVACLEVDGAGLGLTAEITAV